MEYYSSHINKLIEEFSRLPGIGAKSAQRLAFHVLNMPKDQVESLAHAIVDAKENVRYCKCCYTLTDQEICPICSNPKRNKKVIMVVENTRDLAAYEKTGKFDGVYHVLHGAISPMLGIGPDDIKLKELMERVSQSGCGRGDHCHQFQSGGRDYGYVYQQTVKACRDQGNQDRQRRACGRRPGIYR